MTEILRASLQAAVAPDKAEISQVKHLSSYNWIEAPTPTIVVPGAPARWRPREGANRVSKDSGLQYIAQNAARHPENPLEPLFRSLYAENPLFNLTDVDVITDRNNIRKLLAFASPEPNKKDVENFTIDVEIVKDTTIFCRAETATVRVIGPHEFRGHGHEFEKAYTVYAVPKSTGHHRVISYRFCGLKFIVRHETDGYVENLAKDDSGDDDVLRMMQDLALSSRPKTTTDYTPIGGSKLRIGKGGQTVPLRSTLEIKTRTLRKPLPLSEVAAQLWASQTPNLVRAYHDRGTFQKPQVENVAARIRQWEADNEPGLRKLAWLIRRITALAKECGGKARVKYDANADKLVVSQDDGRRDMLPHDLYAKWNSGAA
ncbi:geranylgeranyl pyrophosphate synthetase [Beauveria bassiana ARSEF 2860]|uniref:Geranylgeranyl pyrophosphate synthetase n=1 Tax=Beauveria bassiana (strain ARSEF 2860) TaxID=655819 RepID=J5J4X2_BEAB2|nr:geranylgeranyl pyrophosphate synthetase [Beauveria bassiana ARSEF 2860]EJP61688.1 geranylgeranyl pyrophosphate synthetase [Beauveria bassiana ARSEF 2860]